MTPEEAVDRMDLLGHDFYLFANAETERVNVVYRRRGGGFGLIEPEA
jgi:putative sigma-54 modulation protein